MILLDGFVLFGLLLVAMLILMGIMSLTEAVYFGIGKRTEAKAPDAPPRLRMLYCMMHLIL